MNTENSVNLHRLANIGENGTKKLCASSRTYEIFNLTIIGSSSHIVQNPLKSVCVHIYYCVEVVQHGKVEIMANNQSGKKKFHKDFYFAVPNLEFKQRSIIFVELYIKMYKKNNFWWIS